MSFDLDEIKDHLEWTKIKFVLNERVNNAKTRTVHRGDVYKCNLGIGVGSEMRKERPCVIVQNEGLNKNSSNIIIVPVTHTNNISLSYIVPISTQSDNQDNVILDGCVNVTGIRCVSKARLGNYVAKLTNQELKEIDREIANLTGIIKHYNDLNDRLTDKLNYIEKIKKDRNSAQDIINKLKEMTGIESDEELLENIKNLLTK